MKNKDKIFIVIGVLFVVVLMVISFNIKDKNYDPNEVTKALSEDPNTILANAEKESEEAKTKELDELPKISIDDYFKYYNENTPKVVLVASPTCHYCQIAEPIIKEIVTTNKIEINYLDSSTFTEEEYKKFTESNEILNNGFGTPLLLIVGNGNIIDKVDGLTDKGHYLQFFSKNNILE